MSQQLRNNEEQIKSLYRQSYQHTWSPMSSEIPAFNRNTIRDLENISLCMEYPTVSQFEVPTYSQRNDYTQRRASLPYTNKTPTTHHYHHFIKPKGSSLLTDLQTIRKFRLEKIPEVPTGPSSTENDTESETRNLDHSSDSSNSTNSDSSQKPIVATNNTDKTT